jgi:putative Mg2+ transporter-C (MgtC) family protein
MLTFPQMALRLLIAIGLGAFMGWEREFIGKEAGIRTSMLIGGGASLFAMMGLVLPYIGNVPVDQVIARSNGAVGIIANIVVGVGFIGAGLIIRAEDHIHNITTAAVVWAVAAVGTLCGIGLLPMAAFSAGSFTVLLFFLRNLHIEDHNPEKARK